MGQNKLPLIGLNVSRPIYLDDGDKCLPKSPLKKWSTIKTQGRTITVRWENGQEQDLLPHGVTLED